MRPLDKLKHHVTGAIQRGEKQAIEAVPAKFFIVEDPKDGFYITREHYPEDRLIHTVDTIEEAEILLFQEIKKGD